MRKIIGYYLVFLCVVVTGYWIVTLTDGSLKEGTIEIGFHVFSELIMAVLCLVGGLMMIMKHPHARNIALIGMAMVMYSVLNAAGYFGELHEWGAVAMFVFMFIITSAFLLALILRKG